MAVIESIESGGLSTREAEMLELAVEGLTDKEIAARLGVSITTVRTYWLRVRGKLGAQNRSHAISIAFQRTLEHFQVGKEQLRLLLSTVHMGLWEWKVKSDQVSWEAPECGQRYSAWKSSPTLRAFLEQVHRDDRANLSAMLHSTSERKAQFRHQFRMMTMDGEYRGLNIIARSEHDLSHKVASVHGIVWEVPERRASDSFDAMFRQSPDVVVVLGPDRRITSINRAAVDYFGVPITEALGQKLDILQTRIPTQVPAMVDTVCPCQPAASLTLAAADGLGNVSAMLVNGPGGEHNVCLIFHARSS